ncbi:MAG: extracellular solute-binding protein [Magnetococcus sp. DMHC-8]
MTTRSALTPRPTLFPATAMPGSEWWQVLWPDPAGVLEGLGLRAGMTVVDLCCGDGHFTLPLARLVHPGRVIAVDLEPEVLALARAACQGQDNCQFLLADAQELVCLVPEPVHAVLIANTLHGVPDPLALVRSAGSVLREEGCLAIINWQPLPREETIILGMPRGPATGMRMAPERVLAIVEAAGLTVERQWVLPPYHYGVICRKPPGKAWHRRTVLRSGVAWVVGAAMARAPFIHAQEKCTLRVLGTHVTLREEIRRQAEQDLDIHILFEPGGDARILQKASARPDSFDIYEQWTNSIHILWRAGAIQPIDLSRIRLWNEVNDLTKTGRLLPNASLGLGDAPYRLLHVQPDGSLGSTPSGVISFLPYVHNVDSFGYDTRIVPRGEPYVTESWGWLFDERWHGRVAMINDPTIGIFDAILAAQALGHMTCRDMGNMTKAELDQLFALLIEMKQKGHFSGFWTSVPESVDYVASGRAAIASMFSPGATALNERGIPVVYAAPREGYRAWHGVMCLSAQTVGRVRDAAYDFMNWWLSGWPGAYVARQGYYISVPERARPYLTPAEWDYWYEGKPAAMDLRGPEGRVAVRAGEVRNGGSYWERFSRVAVWNTVMDTYEYSLPRWNELLLS